jgi:hypothetical protein
MNIPGFTAEASVYRGVGHKASPRMSADVGRLLVIPALRGRGDAPGGGDTSAACLGDCTSSCINEGANAAACAKMCERLCFPHGGGGRRPPARFTGPCEDQAWACIQKAGFNPVAIGICYGKWVYCKASTGQ